MLPIVEPRQRPERFLLNRFSPLAESAALLGLGGFDAAGSVWYPDARRLLGAVPNDGTLTNMDPATAWTNALGRAGVRYGGDNSGDCITLDTEISRGTADWTWASWVDIVSRYDTEGFFAETTVFKSRAQFGIGTSHLSLIDFANTSNSWTNVMATGLRHYAITRSGNNFTLYIDGKSQGVLTTATGNYAFRYFGTRSELGAAGDALDGMMYDTCLWSEALGQSLIQSLADPSNVMLEVGGVPLILPPRRVAFPAAVAAGGFQPYWARRSYQIIGGGIA